MTGIISPIEQRRHLRDAERAVLAAVARWHSAQLAMRDVGSWPAQGPGEGDDWLSEFHARGDVLSAAEQTLAAAFSAWRAAGGRAE